MKSSPNKKTRTRLKKTAAAMVCLLNSCGVMSLRVQCARPQKQRALKSPPQPQQELHRYLQKVKYMEKMIYPVIKPTKQKAQ